MRPFEAAFTEPLRNAPARLVRSLRKRVSRPYGKGDRMTILWIIVVVVVVLALLGFLGFR
jgi:hypothetical protein